MPSVEVTTRRAATLTVFTGRTLLRITEKPAGAHSHSIVPDAQPSAALRGSAWAATSAAFVNSAAYSLPNTLAQNRTAASTCD